MRTMAAIAVVLAGCSSTPREWNDLRVGMTRPEVVALIGQPTGTSARDGVEFLTYEITRGPDRYVKLENGAVTSYGRMGDFDSVQRREKTININANTPKSGASNAESLK